MDTNTTRSLKYAAARARQLEGARARFYVDRGGTDTIGLGYTPIVQTGRGRWETRDNLEADLAQAGISLTPAQDKALEVIAFERSNPDGQDPARLSRAREALKSHRPDRGAAAEAVRRRLPARRGRRPPVPGRRCLRRPRPQAPGRTGAGGLPIAARPSGRGPRSRPAYQVGRLPCRRRPPGADGRCAGRPGPLPGRGGHIPGPRPQGPGDDRPRRHPVRDRPAHRPYRRRNPDRQSADHRSRQDSRGRRAAAARQEAALRPTGCGGSLRENAPAVRAAGPRTPAVAGRKCRPGTQ